MVRPPDTSIMFVRDNKQAIWTFMADDGFYQSVLKFNDMFKKYGLKGTVALVSGVISKIPDCADWEEAVAFTKSAATWADWQSLIDQGRIDVSNHTRCHKVLTTLSPTELDAAINGGRMDLMNNLNLHGEKIFTFVAPRCTTSHVIDAKIAENHYCARSGGEGTNSLDPQNWYYLKVRAPCSNMTVDLMDDWIDTGIANHEWIIEMWHGLDGEEGWQTVRSVSADAHFAYVSAKKRQLWVATYNEATKYIRERQNAKLYTVVNTASHIRVNLTDSLDNTIFNYPLTLRTLLPDNWRSAKIIQNGKTKYLAPVMESGRNCAYYDAVPDQGDIDLYPL